MSLKDDIRWFKEQFQDKIWAAIQGTPYSVDMLTAIAVQETGEIWRILRKKNLTVDQVVELCVGDTFDDTSNPPRGAFPRNREELLAQPNGQQMYEIARQALKDMSQHIPGYSGPAANPKKFCHGFGIFQYDLQFFKPGTPESDPDYFLQKQYATFDGTLGRALKELKAKTIKIGYHNKPALTDLEMCHIAIAYNTGGFNPAKGLKQGHKSGGKRYGEWVFEYLQQSKAVTVNGAVNTPSTPPGTTYRVTSTNPLRLRSEPAKDPNNPDANVKARLPNGHVVRAKANQPVNGYLEVETDLAGEQVTGFASTQFLQLV
jgi:hypothetical protein